MMQAKITDKTRYIYTLSSSPVYLLSLSLSVSLIKEWHGKPSRRVLTVSLIRYVMSHECHMIIHTQVNIANIADIVRELFQENIVRGR